MNPVIATRMVEENKLLDRAGPHLSKLAKMDGSLRCAIGLAGGIQSVHVGFAFLGPSLGAEDGSRDKTEAFPIKASDDTPEIVGSSSRRQKNCRFSRSSR